MTPHGPHDCSLLVPTPFVPTTYTASVIPQTHRLACYEDLVVIYTIRVERRSEGRWAVTDGFAVYSKSLYRRHEPTNSSRTDHFKRTYRHTLQDAFVIAEKVRQKKLRWLEEKYPPTDTQVSPQTQENPS